MLERRSFSNWLRSLAAIAALSASFVVGGSRAGAQVPGLVEPFVASDFFTTINGPDGSHLPTSELPRFFNQARCNCQTPVQLYVALLQSGMAKRATAVTSPAGTVSAVMGYGCKTALSVAQGGCIPLSTQPVLPFLDQGQTTFQTDAQVLSTYFGAVGSDAGASGPCVTQVGQFNQTLNVNFDFDGDGTIDLSLTDYILIDLAPPPAPVGVTVQPASEALDVRWSPISTTLVPDLLGYQVLCSRADQYQVFNETATAAGGATGPFTAAFVGCPSARTAMGVEGVDPTFVCSPLLGTGATSTRVEVLQNAITYAAAVVAVDQSGNAALSAVRFNAPTKASSFYDTYRNGDPPGGASGGLCAVGAGRPSPKQSLGGLSLFAVAALGLCRRRARR